MISSAQSTKARNKSGHELRPLLDIPALAEVLGTTPRHIRRLVTEHRIPYLKCGHFVRFDPQDIARWLAAARVPTSEEETGL